MCRIGRLDRHGSCARYVSEFEHAIAWLLRRVFPVCEAILLAYSHTDDLVSPVVRNENGRSVPAAILREFLGNNNGMRRGVIGRRKNRSRFVGIPAAVVNVEIKLASLSRNFCLR